MMTVDTRRNRIVVRIANLLLRAAGSEYRERLRDAFRAGLMMKASATATAQLLEAAHNAADELDDWYRGTSSGLGGCSPGGIVRHAVHEAIAVSIDECPACQRRAGRHG